MSELDKLFKDKLENRAFEFKDAYWEEAERMIEQDEDRRRRGGLWWKLGLFLLLFTVVGYFAINGTNSAALSKASEKSPLYTVPETVANTESKTSNSKTQNSINQNSENEISNSEAQTKNNKSQTINNEIQYSNPKLQNPNSGVSSYEKNSSRIKTTPKGSLDSPSQDDIKALDIDEIDVQSPLPDSTATTKKEIAIQTNTAPSSEEQNTVEKQEERTEITELALLETIPSELEIPEKDCKECFGFKKIKYNPFTFGLTAESIIYPFNNGNSSWVGGSMGITGRYKLNRKFAIRSAVQYSFINGTSGRITNKDDGGFLAENQRSDYDFYSQDQYSFGYRNVQSIFPPKIFHSLDLPLTVQWRNQKSTIEAGVQWNLLLGVRGSEIKTATLFPWEQSTLGASSSLDVSEDKNDRWLPKDNYKKLLTRLTLGYHYAISPSFTLNANAYYRVQKGNNDSSFDTASVFDSSNAGSFTPQRLHFRLGATWNFIK